MTNDTTDGPGPPVQPTRKQAREVRLAQELRANLTRRKALTRARTAGPDVAGDDSQIEADQQPASPGDEPE